MIKKILIGMSILLFTFLTVSFNASHPLPNVIVKNQSYQVRYSQSFEQPLEVLYRVKCNKNSKERYSRSGLNFYKIPSVHTSDDKDYYKNEWDKGHMAPAAAFNCDYAELKLSFSYINCALQHQDLNRGPWKDLESYEKELASNNEVTIRIYVDFVGSSRLTTGAMVPIGFTKVISLNGKLFKSYYFPNKSVSGNFENYLLKKY